MNLKIQIYRSLKAEIKVTAKVFPDPVCAMEMMSLPDMAMGQLIDWIAVGLS